MQSLGNHELDEEVSGLIPFLKNVSTIPVLAANIKLDKEPELQKQNNLLKSIVLEKNNVKIGIIGYLTPETKTTATKGNNIEYEEEVVAITREIKHLKKQGVNIFIALGHSGFETDMYIAQHVEDIDIIIGGHSHSFLFTTPTNSTEPEVHEIEGNYPHVEIQRSGRKVLVVQAYYFTKYLGKLHLLFDSAGEVIDADGEPLLLNYNMRQDEDVLKIVDKYRTQYRKLVGNKGKKTIGSSLVTLNGSCRVQECILGDLISDAILNYTRENYNDQYPNVNIAMVQGGRIRATIDNPVKPFNLTEEQLTTVLPFGGNLVILTMNGTVLRQSLEHSVGGKQVDNKGRRGGFQNFSGMKVIYDASKPEGSRVVEAKAVCSNCGLQGLQDINDNYEYKMITPSYLADGGDNYYMFKTLPRQDVPFKELDCLIYFVKKYSPIDVMLDGRITVLNRVHEPFY